MSNWRACEHVILGSILVLSLSATSRAQDQQQSVENAQLKRPQRTLWGRAVRPRLLPPLISGSL